jgi:hypothetical protein
MVSRRRFSRGVLPEPSWEGHASTIDCSWKAWQLAFSNLMRPEPASSCVASFIDPAFNDCVEVRWAGRSDVIRIGRS